MDAEKLARLKELAHKATPGPWKYNDEDAAIETLYFKHRPHNVATIDDIGDADADYIVAVSPDVILAMADEIERLNKEIKSLQEIENGLTEDNFSLRSQYVEDNKKIDRLEKEVDWLAERLKESCQGSMECCYLHKTFENGGCNSATALDWREAARKAVMEDK